jgi:small ligand-binding sensory domain FIST
VRRYRSAVPFAAAVSEHPLATHAVGEVVGHVLESVGETPAVVALFASASHTGAMEDIAGAVQRILRPRALVGSTTGAVVGGPREIEDGPAIALWACSDASTLPVRLTTEHGADGPAVTGFPEANDLPDDAAAVLLLADPFSFPTEQFLAGLREAGVDLPVVGGHASGGRGPGGNSLVLNYQVVADGAVAVVLGGIGLDLVVSQGCRPVGEPMAVTRGEQQVIYELAGRPALERVEELVARLHPDDLALAKQGLHVGRVIDERKVDYARGDFLVRNVLGGDRSVGAIAVSDEVEVGDTVQFQVRDAASADEDLRALLTGSTADAALLFTCNGRGSALFGETDHDASLVAELTGAGAVAGMSAAGEVGPVGGRSFLHGFTASVALFRERATTERPDRR